MNRGHHLIPRAGFTLVELSIVLVILGLLIGGVLTGQSLIRASELRAVVTEGNQFLTAAHAFRDKYFAKPGDMNNATSFWGVLAGTGSDAACQNTVATGLPTCDGNGDGQVGTVVVTADERARFWQHLSNAGLISGRFTGVYAYPSVPGSDAPKTKADGSGSWATLYTSGVGNTSWFQHTAGNAFMISRSTGGILAPEEAWNVDTKMDDGLPGTGRVITYKNTTGNCTTATNTAPPGDAGATYALSYKTKECLSLYWLNAF